MISEFRGPTRWLSNFADARVKYDGVWYPTTEHAYQAAKTLDLTQREAIQFAPKPRDAKHLGEKVTVRSDWFSMNLQVMEDVNRQKFREEPYKSLLLATGDEELVEGNTWGDTFWGECPLGNGQNNLGKILMKIRSELRV